MKAWNKCSLIYSVPIFYLFLVGLYLSWNNNILNTIQYIYFFTRGITPNGTGTILSQLSLLVKNDLRRLILAYCKLYHTPMAVKNGLTI